MSPEERVTYEKFLEQNMPTITIVVDPSLA